MSGLHLALIAFALVVATGFRWFQLAFAVALPKNRSIFLIGMILGAGLGIAALIEGAGVMGAILAGLSIFLGCFFVFTFLISAQKGGSGQLQPGSELIAFTAPDHRGIAFDSATLAGRPILLKFFRGHW